MTQGNTQLDTASPRRQLTLTSAPALTCASTAPTTAHASDCQVPATSDAPGVGRTDAAPARDVDVAGALAGIDDAVTELAAIDPDVVHPADLPGAVKRLRRARNRLEAVETSWLAAVQRRHAHKTDGARDAATWARDQLGSSWRDAAGQLHTAGKLDALPATKGAFTDGDISGDAAAEIIKATSDQRLAGRSDVEDQLVDAAKHGGPDLVRKTARKLKTSLADHDQAADDAADRYRDRYADVHVRDDGSVKIDAQLDAVNGEWFLTAWRPLLREMHTTGPQLEVRTRPQRAADALGELARRAIATDVVPDTAGRPARVIVTTDLATLHKAAAAEANARLGHTGPICAETARRLACDANVVPVVLGGASVPIDVGRATRDPTVGQRDCLLVRDKACRGCGAPAHLCVPHHCVHWADLGPTDLNNLVLLCYHCHQLVHEGGWNARWNPDNTVTFTTPDRRHLVRHPPT